MMPLISIIVPIYNVEKYLNKCIDSIISQTYDHLEIFLVDDGSTDKCGYICDEYAKRDLRIRVIHKANGGLSDARNVALEVVTGDYVTFVDSDDWVSEYYIENLYIGLKTVGADMSISRFVDFFDNDTVPQRFNKVDTKTIEVLSAEQCLEKMLYQDGVDTCAWGKLYKRENFDGLRFPKGKLYEDIPVTHKLIEKCARIALIPNVDYMYYQRANGIQRAEYSPKKLDAIKHMNELRIHIKEKYPKLGKASDCRYLSTVCNILFQIPEKEYKEQADILWNELKKCRKTVLFNIHGRRKAKFAALISYGGLSFMRKVYRILESIKP